MRLLHGKLWGHKTGSHRMPPSHPLKITYQLLPRLGDFLLVFSQECLAFSSNVDLRLVNSPGLRSSFLSPLLSPFSFRSFLVRRKQFASLDTHAFRVSPSALNILSRYFPGQRQFPFQRRILKLAAKEIHYSLCDTNNYEVSTCIF